MRRKEMPKARLVGLVTATAVAVDAATKWWVRSALSPGESVPVAGDALRLTYVLNPGAAFGLFAGPWSRGILGLLALVAVAVVVFVVRRTPAGDTPRLVALAMILGGAAGNLVDRVRGPQGVVDFLDVGLASFRWPVFNVADVCVTTGATLLVLLLWAEEEVGSGATGRAGLPSSSPDGAAGAAGP